MYEAGMGGADDRGIVYIATGDQFVEEARHSAETVLEQMPEIPITLMTDREVEPVQFDRVVRISEPREDFGDQVYHLERTPYARTIFLDTDIYVAEAIDDLFEVLDQFDIAAAHNPLNYSSRRIEMAELDEIPACFPEYNSGVVAFESNPSVEAFFSEWQRWYSEALSRGQIYNQAAFRLALYRSDLRIATVPSEYNCVFRRPGTANGKVKAFHGRLLDIETPGAGQSGDVEQAVAEINGRSDLRAFYRVGDETQLADPNLLERCSESIRNRGIVGTIVQAPRFLNNLI